MIFVAGEALVDLVVQVDGTVEAALGGAPFNTARSLGRLGAAVEFVGSLSIDRFGTLMADQLVRDGVGLAHVSRTDRPTTLASAEIDVDGAATYHFYIDGTSAPLLAAPVPGPNGAPDVLFTGGLGLVLDPMAETLTSMIETADDRTMVVVDINCRPNVIDDRDRYVDRINRVLRRADVVKVSDEDLAYLAPGVELLEAADHLRSHGPSAVLVTSGSRATVIVAAADSVEIPVPGLTAPIVDTIGAGDTFGGGLLAWWTSSGLGRGDVTIERLSEAVRAAHAAAAVVVTRRGADPPFRSELATDWV